MTIREYLDAPRNGNPCPSCSSSDAVSFTNNRPNYHATGFFHCFSCGAAGTGAHYLHLRHGITHAEAMRELDAPVIEINPTDLIRFPRRSRHVGISHTMRACLDLVTIRDSLSLWERLWWDYYGWLPARLDTMPEAKRQRARLKYG